MTLSKTAVEEKLSEIQKIADEEGESLIFELEKLIPHTPIKIGVDIYKEYILDQLACPKCARKIGDDFFVFNYCPNCGQKIKK